jgi:cell wall assembly regulator SMI1
MVGPMATKVTKSAAHHRAGASVGALVELSKVWSQKRPGFEKRLRPGASSAALARFVKSLGLKLPPGFLAFYAWHDGTKDEHEPLEGAYGWFSLAGILKHKKMLDTMGFEDEDIYPKYCWSQAWVPFLQANYSDLVCLDTRSGIVFVRYNSEQRVVLLAPSFRAWLAAHIALTQAAPTLTGSSAEETWQRVYDAFNGAAAKRIRKTLAAGFPKTMATAKTLF